MGAISNIVYHLNSIISLIEMAENRSDCRRLVVAIEHPVNNGKLGGFQDQELGIRNQKHMTDCITSL